ncbi:hypothetical protein BH11PAT2_BH11PAT2_00790 [soil metagenome]
MSESYRPLSAELEKALRKVEFLLLAESLSQRVEALPFTGIDAEEYAAIKADEDKFPGFVTPIDERIRRLQEEGLKISFGKFVKSGNVFVLPANSDDIENDSIFPRHLKIVDGMDEELRKLILANKK